MRPSSVSISRACSPFPPVPWEDRRCVRSLPYLGGNTAQKGYFGPKDLHLASVCVMPKARDRSSHSGPASSWLCDLEQYLTSLCLLFLVRKWK